jgi:hypothetical protein
VVEMPAGSRGEGQESEWAATFGVRTYQSPALLYPSCSGNQVLTEAAVLRTTSMDRTFFSESLVFTSFIVLPMCFLFNFLEMHHSLKV